MGGKLVSVDLYGILKCKYSFSYFNQTVLCKVVYNLGPQCPHISESIDGLLVLVLKRTVISHE